MELFLNLAWVLLALPAYWLWRSAPRVGRLRHFTPLQCLLVLGSVLVLLFPVVSASDDLLAMRTEIEESAPGKRTFRQPPTERCSICNSRSQGPAALPTAAPSFSLGNEQWLIPPVVRSLLHAAPSILYSSRAPPRYRLA
jgi:hypothetical protein